MSIEYFQKLYYLLTIQMFQNYQVADLNRFELGYIQPFPLNLHRSGGYSETLSVAPSGSIQEETQQSTGSIENHSPINVSTLNQSSTRSYVESQMETTEYVPTPTTSEETSEDTKNTLNGKITIQIYIICYSNHVRE